MNRLQSRYSRITWKPPDVFFSQAVIEHGCYYKVTRTTLYDHLWHNRTLYFIQSLQADPLGISWFFFQMHVWSKSIDGKSSIYTKNTIWVIKNPKYYFQSLSDNDMGISKSNFKNTIFNIIFTDKIICYIDFEAYSGNLFCSSLFSKSELINK